jgi:hypothetical protein
MMACSSELITMTENKKVVTLSTKPTTNDTKIEKKMDYKKMNEVMDKLPTVLVQLVYVFSSSVL